MDHRDGGTDDPQRETGAPDGPAAWAAPGSSVTPVDRPGGWQQAPLPPYAPAATTAGSTPAVVKGRSRVALAILSVTAVLAATTFAVVALTRPDGAGSAEEAVEHLFEAIENEDAIGVMESLPPGERDVLLDPIVATVGELQRLGLLDTFALEDVPGTDIEVDGLTLAATNLGPGVTKVRITGGTITGTVIPDQIPIGPKTRELADNQGEPLDIQPDTTTEQLADTDLDLVTIEEDGGWHVSLFYTIAEAARGDDTPLPQFGANLITPIGSDTPEGAVRGLIEEAMDLHLGGVIGYLPPDEMRVLYDYLPRYLDDADEAAQDARREGYAASLDQLDLHAEGDGDTRHVTIDGVSVSGGAGDTEASFSWDGSCTVVETTGPESSTFAEIDSGTGDIIDPDDGDLVTERYEVCNDGTVSVTEDGEEVDTDESMPELDLWYLGDDGSFTPTITVVEHDGRWYVSPLGSMFDAMLGALRRVQPADVDRFFDSWDDVLGTGSMDFEDFEELEGTIDDPGGTIPPFDSDDPYMICSEIYADLDADATDEEYDAADEEFDRCLVEHGEEPDAEPAYLGEPRFAGGQIVVPATENVQGYDLDGNLVWEGPACDFPSWATPFAPSVAVDVELVDCGGELVGVDAVDGEELWRIDNPVGAERVRLGPTTFIVVLWEEIQVYDVQTGELLWTQPTVNASMAVSDAEHVYVGTDFELQAFDPATGAELWTTPIGVTGLGVDEGVLVARDSERVVRRIDPATGQVLWESIADNEHLKSSEVVAFTDDTVLLRSTVDPLSVVSYDLATGAQLWVRPVADFGSPIYAGGTTVLAASGGSVTHYDRLTGAAQGAINNLPVDVVGLDLEGGLLAVVGYAGEPDPVLVVLPAP